MKPTLYIMCGPAGCGKTTWAGQFIRDHDKQDIRYVSRDEIRFSILKDGEDYFSHEKEVFKKFSGAVAQTLIDGFDVIADATHITEFSRRKLTQAIDMHGFTEYEIVYVVISIGYDECIRRNMLREGRERVPETIISNMYRDFKFPSLNEDERAKEVIEV